MKFLKERSVLFVVLLVCAVSCTSPVPKPEPADKDNTSVAAPSDPLPSWNDGASKKAITDFVARVTKEGSPDFIPVADRIACFDNDGTLWSEQPLYFQFLFAIDRVKELAPQHPEWKTKEPFKSILKGDIKAALAGGEKALMQVVMATHAGMSNEDFETAVKNWIATAKHPKSNRPYNEMIFQPMVELLDYLRANGFKTYIVSGGDEQFMCAWTEQAYGIPNEQVVGSLLKMEYVMKNDTSHLMRLAEFRSWNDGKVKPVSIEEQIGKIPVFTAGNSDGDYEMLQYTTTATGYPRFGMYVHHTDSLREWAYDSTSHVGHLERGLNDAEKYNWLIVDMKNDWKEVFPKQE